MNQKGIAMVTAIILALVVSATAAVVLSLTFRRFELSAFRTDHTVAQASDEAGFQYAFARMDKDLTSTDLTNPIFTFGGVPIAGFKNLVNRKRDVQGAGPIGDNTPAAEYVVTGLSAAAYSAANNGNTADETDKLELKLGGKVDTTVGSPTLGQYVVFKYVTVRVRYFHNGNGFNDAVPVANRPYKVHSSSTFGTGGP